MTLEFKVLVFVNIISAIFVILTILKLLPHRLARDKGRTPIEPSITELEKLKQGLEQQISVLKFLPKRIRYDRDKCLELSETIASQQQTNDSLKGELSHIARENEGLKHYISNLENRLKAANEQHATSLLTIESQKAELLEKKRYLQNCWDKISRLEAGLFSNTPDTLGISSSFDECKACDKSIHFCTCGG